MTGLILQLFRANGRLLQAGDQLVSGLGLTSARWQILGGIAEAECAQPVVQLARAMGVTRQAVQRIVNDLEREGLVAFRPNPQHKRAQLVVLTAPGRTLFEAALALQRPWVARLAAGLSQEQVAVTSLTLDRLLAALDGQSSMTRGAGPSSRNDGDGSGSPNG